MTKEPIMIDDVDVSKCEYHRDTHKELLADGNIKIFANYCQINNDGCYAINCYYKQLKRKEQECEYAQRQVDYFKDLYSQENDNKVALEQEREELLTKIDIQKKENIIFTLEARKLVAQYSSKLERLRAQNKKLKQYKASKQASYETMQIEWNEAKNEVKQLKAELEKYKPILDRLLQQFETYDKLKSLDVVTFAKQTFEQLDQLEAANEKLKNKYHKATAKMTIKEIDQSTYIAQLEKTLNRIRTERDNYKQALQEIKKIAETLKKDICSYCDSKDTDRCDQTDTDELQQIIQICKGALNE